MRATITKRHTDGSGWLDVKVECDIGTVALTVNAEGDYFEGAPWLDPSAELWLALAEAVEPEAVEPARECEGHPDDGEHNGPMGVTVYCDGSCVS